MNDIVIMNKRPPRESKGTIIVVGEWSDGAYCGTTWWRNKTGKTFALFNWATRGRGTEPLIKPFKHDTMFEFNLYLEAIKCTLERAVNEWNQHENP